MSITVLTAAAGESWEAGVVAALGAPTSGCTVARRCVDVADLLATAAAGLGRAAVVSGRLRRLDREAVHRLAADGVALVAMVPAGDEATERLVRQLGVPAVLPADADPAAVVAAVTSAVGAVGPRRPPPDPSQSAADEPGRLVAVWGPTGAPGRTTVAIGVAAELAAAGHSVLLVDADVYGGVVAQALGIVDDVPGLAGACRLANAGRLDVAALAAQARQLSPHLRVLPGITRAERWPELRPSALDAVLPLARRLAGMTIVDVGFALEQDEELAYDTVAPRRNGATLAVLEAADAVVAVGAADPIGLQRLIRGLGELRERVPGAVVHVLVNRVRPGAVPGDPRAEVAQALDRYAGVTDVTFVPDDRAGFDAAVAAGRTLVEAAAGSPARQPLAALAGRLADTQLTPPRSRRLSLRRR